MLTKRTTTVLELAEAIWRKVKGPDAAQRDQERTI
jgi:hypothetical protein